MDILRKISEALQNGNNEKVTMLTKKAVEENISPKEILDKGLIEGMNIIGDKYKNHIIFLPDVLLAAKAMYGGIALLKPMFIEGNMPSAGKVVIGTVQGDLHDIGKNLVGIMLKGAGFEVIDLGNNVPPEKFVRTVKKENASIVGMSTLLTTTMPVMRDVVNLIKKENLEDSIKIIVGGAPVSAEFAREIGADAYSYDSANAVETVKALIAEKDEGKEYKVKSGE